MWGPAPLCALGRRLGPAGPRLLLLPGGHRPGPRGQQGQQEQPPRLLGQRELREIQKEHREQPPTLLFQRGHRVQFPRLLFQRGHREQPPMILFQRDPWEQPLRHLFHWTHREQPPTPLSPRDPRALPPTPLSPRDPRALPPTPRAPRTPRALSPHGPGWAGFPRRSLSSRAGPYPRLDGRLLPVHRHVFQLNLRNSEAAIQRYWELLERVRKGGGENAVLRHTQRNKKLFVRERLKLLLDDEAFLELSPLAGLGMPYGDVPAAGCLTGIGKICGIWCVFMASDATVKGGTIYPIGVKKQLRAQEIALENRLLSVHLVDSGGAFLPLQSELFPDKLHGGRIFYNEAIMSAMGLPQVAVVCGSCVAGGAYVPTMAEETVIIDKIGTLFLAGPPLVKAATGEYVSPEDLGGAKLHSQVSGCADHFAPSEEEAYECIRRVISTLNFQAVPERDTRHEQPLYSPEELLGLAPQDYSCTLPVKLILSRLVDGSRFQEFKANYGTTLVTGFGHVEGHLVGIVANNGELARDAALKGSHFVQLCSQRGVPILFLQNSAPQPAGPASIKQAEAHSSRLKAQASMMAAVACSAVPKVTVVIGGCFGSDSYAMPVQCSVLCRLEEESSAFYSSARLWDDGIILPQNTRKVVAQCLEIMAQQQYQTVSQCHHPILRM
ncbi:putative methylcrotonoyl-CoA carboxylase beta chain, mitochondrial [Willisornis vidua]|uniref:methylcrotonoyl-CoA carboxylase n=1 Tax=Willisornis vidua TaxID=1566151 RepID=A0ABQ9D5Y1_9PASS|nr:putative methylcrotonoyl-CoA carboxylase beta chain, mitochondrial [Willisornis vidua]